MRVPGVCAGGGQRAWMGWCQGQPGKNFVDRFESLVFEGSEEHEIICKQRCNLICAMEPSLCQWYIQTGYFLRLK